MRKYLVFILILLFVVPSVAFASWWNPTTWKVFSFIHKKNDSTIKQPSSIIQTTASESDKILELQKQIDELKSEANSNISSGIKSKKLPSASSNTDTKSFSLLLINDYKSADNFLIKYLDIANQKQQFVITDRQLVSGMVTTDSASVSSYPDNSILATWKKVDENELSYIDGSINYYNNEYGALMKIHNFFTDKIKYWSLHSATKEDFTNAELELKNYNESNPGKVFNENIDKTITQVDDWKVQMQTLINNYESAPTYNLPVYTPPTQINCISTTYGGMISTTCN